MHDEPTVVAEDDASQSATAQRLREIWCDLLGWDDIKPSTDFFAAGGDSLGVLRLCDLVASEFGVRVSPQTLAANATMGVLIDYIESASEEALNDIDGGAPERAVSIDGRCLLSHQQKANAVHASNRANARRAEFCPCCCGLMAPLMRLDLQRALRRVIDSNPMLACRLERSGDGHRQRADRNSDDFVLDVRNVGDSELDAALLEDASVPFDLYSDWLFSCGLFGTNTQSYWLSVTCHHLVADGQSLRALLNQLCAELSDEPVGIAKTTTRSYFDYVQNQQRWLGSAEFAAQMEYWREQLVDLPDGALPGETRAARFFQSRRQNHRFAH